MNKRSIVSKVMEKLGGAGAGVSVKISGHLDYVQKKNKIVFKESLVDVEFKSYDSTERTNKGLSVKLEDITDKKEVEDFKDYISGSEKDVEDSVHVTFKDDVYDPSYEKNSNTKLVLSKGWTRAKYEEGDDFQIKLWIGGDNGRFIEGEATFTKNGQYAWEDLDNVEDDEE